MSRFRYDNNLPSWIICLDYLPSYCKKPDSKPIILVNYICFKLFMFHKNGLEKSDCLIFVMIIRFYFTKKLTNSITDNNPDDYRNENIKKNLSKKRNPSKYRNVPTTHLNRGLLPVSRDANMNISLQLYTRELVGQFPGSCGHIGAVPVLVAKWLGHRKPCTCNHNLINFLRN